MLSHSFYVAVVVKPFAHFFFFALCFFWGLCHRGNTWLSQMSMCPFEHINHIVGLLQAPGSSCPRPWLNARCSRSHGLDWLAVSVALGPSSPTTFYPCGLQRPSPDALCAFRRQREGPEEATPSIRRRASKARNLLGAAPPAPRPRRDAASTKRLSLFEHRPAGKTPVSRNARVQ